MGGSVRLLVTKVFIEPDIVDNINMDLLRRLRWYWHRFAMFSVKSEVGGVGSLAYSRRQG